MGGMLCPLPPARGRHLGGDGEGDGAETEHLAAVVSAPHPPGGTWGPLGLFVLGDCLSRHGSPCVEREVDACSSHSQPGERDTRWQNL